jgi:hypothetical protein
MTAAAARLRIPGRASYQLALALSLALGYAVVVTGYVAVGKVLGDRSSQATPNWSQSLLHVTPYRVQRDYGTSRGRTCDLTIYTTNAPALDGKARLHPGDTTATVCVVRKVRMSGSAVASGG